MTHPLAQRFRGDVDELDHVGPVEHAIRQRLADRDPADLLDQVLDALQVLDVDGGDHINAGVTQVLDILPSLAVAQAGRVGVSQLVHQHDLRAAGEHRLQVHVLQRGPAVLDLDPRHDLQAWDQLDGPRAAVGLDVGHDHVVAVGHELVRVAQHSVGLAGPRRAAEVDLQPAAGRRRTRPVS
jgi:hypothetical protein